MFLIFSVACSQLLRALTARVSFCLHQVNLRVLRTAPRVRAARGPSRCSSRLPARSSSLPSGLRSGSVAAARPVPRPSFRCASRFPHGSALSPAVLPSVCWFTVGVACGRPSAARIVFGPGRSQVGVLGPGACPSPASCRADATPTAILRYGSRDVSSGQRFSMSAPLLHLVHVHEDEQSHDKHLRTAGTSRSIKTTLAPRRRSAGHAFSFHSPSMRARHHCRRRPKP